MGVSAISAAPAKGQGPLEEQDKLIAKLNAVLAQDQRNVDAYLGRGNAYLDLGRYRKAVADYDRVLGLEPNHGEAEENRAKALKLREIDQEMGSRIVRDW